MAEIVFVTLFLGLVSGPHPLELRAGPAVKSIRITLDGRELAHLQRPPWRTRIDLGPELRPRELVAVGYDDGGAEIGRASQILNLPRPFADVSILVKRDKETPVAVEAIGRHLEHARPKSAKITLDGKPLHVEKFTARLPEVNWSKPHVITAEVKFVDSRTARREIVLTGSSYVSGAELTPVLVDGAPSRLDRCFSLDGQRLDASAVDRPDALVGVVRDPDATNADRFVREVMMLRTPLQVLMFRREVSLRPDTYARIIWPLTMQFAEGSDAPASLFEWSGDMRASDFISLLSRPMKAEEWSDKPRYYADAVAVAGLQTLKDARRRAVVYLLDDESGDKSENRPAAVRQYLASIGVPLFVWSFGPRPDSAWGEVIDISRRERLRDAVKQVRDTLERQRIVWLPVDALGALRVTADPHCGATPVASR